MSERSAVVVVIKLCDRVVIGVNSVNPGVGESVEVCEVVLLEFVKLKWLEHIGGVFGLNIVVVTCEGAILAT